MAERDTVRNQKKDSRASDRRESEKRKHARRSTLIAVVGAVALGGLIAFLLVVLVTGGSGAGVPDVEGKAYGEAKRIVESSGLAIEIDPLQDTFGVANLDDLKVERQDPKPGTELEEGEPVTVRLEGLYEVPELVEDSENVTIFDSDGEETIDADQEQQDAGQTREGSAQTAPVATGEMICIDPGHSANCPSSEIDPATGLDVADNGGAAGERQAMWELALEVKSRLEQMGYGVVLTKESVDAYSSLRTRADIGNTCSIVVRLHYDFDLHAIIHPGEGQYKENDGNRAYVDPQVAAASSVMAQAMFPALKEAGINRVMNDCGGTSNNEGSAFVGSVLSRVPVVLIENDPSLVRENTAGQERVADAIARGIDSYMQSH